MTLQQILHAHRQSPIATTLEALAPLFATTPLLVAIEPPAAGSSAASSPPADLPQSTPNPPAAAQSIRLVCTVDDANEEWYYAFGTRADLEAEMGPDAPAIELPLGQLIPLLQQSPLLGGILLDSASPASLALPLMILPTLQAHITAQRS